jgi:hypothetical protein
VHTERVTDLEKADSPSMAVQAVGATFAAFLAAPTGPLAPFVAAAATPLTTQLAQRITCEWSRKSHVVEESALESSGLDQDDLADVLTGDPDMIALTQKVLQAAAASGNEQKLRGLGGLLGRAAAQGDRLDETQILIAAVADLKAPQVLVLDVLARPAPGQQTVPDRVVGWTPAALKAQVNLDPEFVLACLNTLTRHGLATPIAGTGLATGEEQRFMSTRLGEAIAEAMHATQVR